MCTHRLIDKHDTERYKDPDHQTEIFFHPFIYSLKKGLGTVR